MVLTVEQAMQQAVAAHNQGKVQEAERFYSTILQTQPTHPEANHNLGLIAVSVNKAEAALAFFKIALEAKPKIGQFWLSYIDALIKDNQTETAKAVLEQGKNTGLFGNRFDDLDKQLNANSIAPSQLQLNNLLEQYNNGQYDEAEELALLITQQFPEHPFGWKVLGALFGDTNRQSEALDANQKAIQLAPDDAETHNNLANSLIALGRLDEAEVRFRQAITIKSDYHEAYNNLGIMLKDLSRLDEAEVSLKRAISIKPNIVEPHYNLGCILKELGRLDEAEVTFRQAIALKSDDAESHGNLGVTLQELNKSEEAEVSLRQAIAFKSDYAEAHSNLGFVLKKLGRLNEAEVSLRRSLALKSDLHETHNNLGDTLRILGRLDEAEVSLRQATALKADYAEAHNNLGITLQLRGQLDESEVSLRKAIVLKPDFAPAILNLSTVLNYMNNLDAAIHSYKKLLQIDPDNIGLRAGVNLAIYKFLDGDFAQSRKYLLNASNIQGKSSPEFRNGKVFHSYLLKILNWHKDKYFDHSSLISNKSIYVIGESHSLVSHWLPIQRMGFNFLGKALLIFGCKQWHLGNTSRNQYKTKYESIINSLPKYSDVLLAIGEIDCRLDSGIIKHNDKYPEKGIKKSVEITVENYINYIYELNNARENNIIIQGVPCPNINIENISKKKVTELIDLIKMFNYELKNKSKAKGFGFLDLHKLTDRGDGFSNKIWHTDAHHISPEGMLEAWRSYDS
jgi:Flp pilus assembly protein TadD